MLEDEDEDEQTLVASLHQVLGQVTRNYKEASFHRRCLTDAPTNDAFIPSEQHPSDTMAEIFAVKASG